MKDRRYLVRCWVELQVRAPSPEVAEAQALETIRGLRLPPRPEDWQAATFGSQPCPDEYAGPERRKQPRSN